MGLPEAPVRGVTLRSVKIEARQGLTIGYAEVSGEDVQINSTEGEGIKKLASADVKLRYESRASNKGRGACRGLCCRLRFRLPVEEDRRDVAHEEILRHVLRNHGFVHFQQSQVARTHLCCNLEANVQQLPQAAVVCSRFAHMPQCRRVLF